MKFCNKFALSCLEITVKGQLFRVSGSQFLNWLFGHEELTGISRKGPLVTVARFRASSCLLTDKQASFTDESLWHTKTLK